MAVKQFFIRKILYRIQLRLNEMDSVLLFFFLNFLVTPFFFGEFGPKIGINRNEKPIGILNHQYRHKSRFYCFSFFIGLFHQEHQRSTKHFSIKFTLKKHLKCQRFFSRLFVQLHFKIIFGFVYCSCVWGDIT